jgi:hypothetical protein
MRLHFQHDTSGICQRTKRHLTSPSRPARSPISRACLAHSTLHQRTSTYLTNMANVTITCRDLTFTAMLERSRAPATCAAFEALLPFEHALIQARWSGEAAWVPLGEMDMDIPAENSTSYPEPGQLLLYGGGISEVELLVPYGRTVFACRDGQLVGNHFLTIITGAEQLPELGRRVLWEGAQKVIIRRDG